MIHDDQGYMFLRLLTKEESPRATFVTLTDGVPGKPLQNAHYVDVERTLHALNRAGADVFVVVNQTDGVGRRAENIVSARSCWADYDHGVPEQTALPPSIMVRSSAGKAQYYWLLAEPVAADERWQAANRGISRATNGDENSIDAARILRLPGFVNHKYPDKPLVTARFGKNIFSVIQRYFIYEIEAAWPPVASLAAGGAVSAEDAARAALHTAEATKLGRYTAWLENAGPPPTSSSKPGASRSWLFRKASAGVRDFALPIELVVDTLLVALNGQEPDYRELIQIVKDANKYSTHPVGCALLDDSSIEIQ